MTWPDAQCPESDDHTQILTHTQRVCKVRSGFGLLWSGRFGSNQIRKLGKLLLHFVKINHYDFVYEGKQKCGFSVKTLCGCGPRVENPDPVPLESEKQGNSMSQGVRLFIITNVCNWYACWVQARTGVCSNTSPRRRCLRVHSSNNNAQHRGGKKECQILRLKQRKKYYIYSMG